MTESRKGVRQDYVLRVRYQNTLPPPAFEPKLLKLPDSFSRFSSASFISNLIHEQYNNVDVDSELGMPIDLSIIQGLFEGDESALFPIPEVADLDIKDRQLLRNIGDAHTGKLTADVAFLRRTQYISSEIGNTNKAKQQEAEKASKIKAALKIELGPEEQLAAVEKTFQIAQRPIDSLRHPTKKNIKAVKCWPVLPNTGHLDQQYVNAKFPSNPAPKTKSSVVVEDEDPRLEVACLVPRIIDETSSAVDNDYIAYFIPSVEDAVVIANNNAEPGDRTHGATYKFIREYDAKKDDAAAEWAITLEADTALYIELGGRMNMRGRRRGAQVTSTNEVVEVTMRDLNTGEQDVLDAVQQQFNA